MLLYMPTCLNIAVQIDSILEFRKWTEHFLGYLRSFLKSTISLT